MLKFIIRRLGESVLVMLGVLLLTFVLFQMAAGDPAAAVLGKNPKPLEIENLRRELKSDLPLFYGHWCKSEVYTSCDYRKKSAVLPGIELPDNAEFKNGAVYLPYNESVKFQRRFPVGDKVLCRISGSGIWSIDNREIKLAVCRCCGGSSSQEIILESVPETLIVKAVEKREHNAVEKVEFFRYQANPFNSQFVNSLRELVDFKSSFPYITILNFGKTITTREPINHIIARGIIPSLSVMLPVFIFELLLGIIFALIATACKDTFIDRAVLVLSVAGMSISYLVLIIAGQWFLGYYLNWFPVWGWSGMRSLMLPILLGVVSGLGGGVRFYRTIFVNELKNEYLRTALAKGCNKPVVFGKHLLRNAMVPIIARASTVLPFIFTGSLLLESFFGIPGLGYASIDALNNSDLALLKALTIVNALLFVVINLIADLLCAWADPRIRIK